MAPRGLVSDEPRLQFHSPAEDDAITLSLSAMSGSLSMYVGVAFTCAWGCSHRALPTACRFVVVLHTEYDDKPTSENFQWSAVGGVQALQLLPGYGF